MYVGEIIRPSELSGIGLEMILSRLVVDPALILEKTGNLSEEDIDAALAGIRSSGGQSSLSSRLARVFVFDLDRADVEKYGSPEFYRRFVDEFVRFVQNVPEYLENKHASELIARLKSDDFSTIYGKYEPRLGQTKHRPLMDSDRSFASNLTHLLNPFGNINFPSDYDFPILVPFFNLHWPVALSGDALARAIEILKSPAQNGSDSLMTDENQRRANEHEDEIVNTTRCLVRFVTGHIWSGKNYCLRQIIAAPLYFRDALDYQWTSASWTRGLSMDTIMGEIAGTPTIKI